MKTHAVGCLLLILLSPLWLVGVVFEACVGRKIGD